MKVNVIKKLAESASIDQLKNAEEEILNEQDPTVIDVEGVDLGEKYTHVIGAIWVIEEVEKTNLPIKDVVRQYVQKVRNSIT